MMQSITNNENMLQSSSLINLQPQSMVIRKIKHQCKNDLQMLSA